MIELLVKFTGLHELVKFIGLHVSACLCMCFYYKQANEYSTHSATHQDLRKIIEQSRPKSLKFALYWFPYVLVKALTRCYRYVDYININLQCPPAGTIGMQPFTLCKKDYGSQAFSAEDAVDY